MSSARTTRRIAPQMSVRPVMRAPVSAQAAMHGNSRARGRATPARPTPRRDWRAWRPWPGSARACAPRRTTADDERCPSGSAQAGQVVSQGADVPIGHAIHHVVHAGIDAVALALAVFREALDQIVET